MSDHLSTDTELPSDWFWLLLVLFAVGLIVIGGVAGWALRQVPECGC